jgi:hypothetical protein
MRYQYVEPATPAQWLEHSEAWRYAHLDLAPSEAFRRMAIQEHERLQQSAETGGELASHSWRGRLSRRHRA